MDSRQRFITMVEQGAGLDPEAARRAARATLDTLYERVSGGEARDLAVRLPPELAREEKLLPDRHAEPFHADEFLRRVAGREAVDPSTAERHAVIVLTALRTVVGESEFDEMVAQLPDDFLAIISDARRPHAEIHSADQFIRTVAHRTRLDVDAAGRATNAVLETLGERITDNEVEDLMSQLPAELAEAVRRGVAHSHGAARRLSADKFLGLVAQREGTKLDQAHEHARAVFATLRESVTDKQFSDLLLHLPDDYAELAAPRKG